jgi:hypothetical protein
MAAAIIAMVLAELVLTKHGNCARGGPYTIARECTGEEENYGWLLGAGIVATVIAGCGLVLTLGVGAMFLGMGSAFLAGSIAVLIGGTSVISLAVTWGVAGTAFLIGGCFALWAERRSAAGEPL